MKMSAIINDVLVMIILLNVFTSCNSKIIAFTEPKNREFESLDETKKLYYCKYEVTNVEYRGFLNSLKVNEPEEFIKCKMDSSNWNKEIKTISLLGAKYGWSPFFDYYPVVNITHYGAQKYCQWLTEKSKKKGFLYRLPTESEFLNLALQANVQLRSDYPEDYESPNFNLRFIGDAVKDGGFFTVPTKGNNKREMKHYSQHKKGIYHVIGNVSEFLNTGESLGGNWFSLPSEVMVVKKPNGSNAKTGFRVWLEITRAGS